MKPVFCVQELYPLTFQKIATDWHLLLLQSLIYSVCTIQYSRIFVEIWATFKQQRTLGDSILLQKDLTEWSAFHFKTQSFSAISNFSFVGHISSFPGNDYWRSEWLPVTIHYCRTHENWTRRTLYIGLRINKVVELLPFFDKGLVKVLAYWKTASINEFFWSKFAVFECRLQFESCVYLDKKMWILNFAHTVRRMKKHVALC